MQETRNTKERNLYLIMILSLLGLNAWLFYQAYQNKEKQLQTETTISELDSMRIVLNERYNSLVDELTRQKGINVDKDIVLDSLLAEIEVRKQDIGRLLSNRQASQMESEELKALLADAQQQLKNLEKQRDSYRQQLADMNVKYGVLEGEYTQLQGSYDEQVVLNEGLTEEKASIIDKASVILASNITLTGIKSKNGGKEKENEKAKRIDRIRICFDLLRNDFSAGTEQEIFIQLIDPNGVVVASGASNGKRIPGYKGTGTAAYTAATTIAYEGDGSDNKCIYWEQNYAFMSGTYVAKIYHKGELIGENSFDFK
ncbi:MAG TPA: hypothetical protein DHW15_02585 [Bacteroidetes bacterium]|jgi:hypothetical protein|nr:MAG: hypothetical protein ABR94_01775 [Sphingobacteriales bacterium BACL12 MAG-120802-bin5]HCK21072.1 hypothetical protein [Bacteroidota bacterium]